MRRYAALALLLLSGCSLRVDLGFPASPPEVSGLRVGQAYYCANRDTDLPFRLALASRADRLEFRWSARGDLPQAGPGEGLVQEGPFAPGEIRGWLRVSPEGQIRGVITTSPQGLTPQGITVEPSLPDRWLWVRALGPGGAGGWAKAGPIRPQTCP